MGLHIETCQGGEHQICSFMWADNVGMPLPFEKKFKILGIHFQLGRKDAGLLGGEDAKCEQSLVERRDLQKQRRSMENKNAEEWRSKSTVYSVLAAKTGLGVERSWKDVKDGRQRV